MFFRFASVRVQAYGINSFPHEPIREPFPNTTLVRRRWCLATQHTQANPQSTIPTFLIVRMRLATAVDRVRTDCVDSNGAVLVRPRRGAVRAPFGSVVSPKTREGACPQD